MSSTALPSYLSAPDPSVVSLLHPRHPPESVQRKNAPKGPMNQFGFPRPSEQGPSSESATTKYYFVDEAKWQDILNYGEFDDIVCGSGFCALAFIDKALDQDPYRKILVLERGGFFLPSHFQNLPLPFSLLLNDSSETYPWALSSKTFKGDLRFIHGSFPFFGGRSPFWSAWSPRPPLELLRDFPKSLKATAGEDTFWKDCKKLLHVVQPKDLFNGEYRALQQYIEDQFEGAISRKKTEVEENIATRQCVEQKIPSADYGEPASLAVGRTTGISQTVFEKFSTPGPLLQICDRQRRLAREGKGSPLTIATRVVVERFDIEDEHKRVNVLQTSRGALCFPGHKKPNIILATGAIPACTIVLNSVKSQSDRRAGSRLIGHFLTHINARFPVPHGYKAKRKRETHWRTEWRKQTPCGGLGNEQTKRQEWRMDGGREDEEDSALQIAAYYLAGRAENGLQYHADITVIQSPRPEEQQEDVMRLCPDFFSAPSEVQMKGSERHVIVACVMLGEIAEGNTECQIERDPRNPDLTTNVRAQVVLSDKEEDLRRVMYEATLQAIRVMAGENESEIEYWRAEDEGDRTGNWNREPPCAIRQFQMAGVVHEASTLYMDDKLPTDPKLEDPEKDPSPVARSRASVDRNYRLYGTDNVYVTGSAIFPTSGSWNPTLMMCGFAQDLATKLCKPEVFKQVFSLSLASNLVNDCKGINENPQKLLQYGLNNVLPTIGTRWKLTWGPAIQRKDDTDNVSWYIAHHPSLEFEDHLAYPTYVIAIAGIPREPLYAWFKGNTQNTVSDFNAWVDGGIQNPPVVVPRNNIAAGGAYVATRTLNTTHLMLTTAAPEGAVSAGTTLLDFFKTVDQSTTPRFVFAGHSLGGALSPSLALALVKAGVISEHNTLTYPSAGTSPGNIGFTTLFEKTFPCRKAPDAASHQGWNLNLVNTHDVVPQAWCASGLVSWKQNLNNIPPIYDDPVLPEVWNTALLAVIWSRISGVLYKPLPSQYFTTRRPAPKTFDEFREIVGQQHVQAYADAVGIAVLLLKRSGLLKRGLVEKTEAEKRFYYPFINDLEWVCTNPKEALEIVGRVRTNVAPKGLLWENDYENVG